MASPKVGENESAHVHFVSSSGMNSPTGSSGPTGSTYARGIDPATDRIFRLAKAQFDNHELERSAWTVESHHLKDDRSLFLKLYANFLASERRLSEGSSIFPKAKGKLPSASPGLIPLLRELINPEDSFLLYLKGIIFAKLRKRLEAVDCYIRSVIAFPYNWSAWKELSSNLGPDVIELADIADLLPDSFMTTFFVEFHQRKSQKDEQENMSRADSLLKLFPDSVYLTVAKGLNAHALMRESSREMERRRKLTLGDPQSTARQLSTFGKRSIRSPIGQMG